MARFITEKNYDGWKFSLINLSLCNEGPAFQSQLKIKKMYENCDFPIFLRKTVSCFKTFPAKTDQ